MAALGFRRLEFVNLFLHQNLTPKIWLKRYLKLNFEDLSTTVSSAGDQRLIFFGPVAQSFLFFFFSPKNQLKLKIIHFLISKEQNVLIFIFFLSVQLTVWSATCWQFKKDPVKFTAAIFKQILQHLSVLFIRLKNLFFLIGPWGGKPSNRILQKSYRIVLNFLFLSGSLYEICLKISSLIC